MSSGMDSRITALERAFQLAKLGQVATLSDLLGTLKRDGYSVSQIDGPVLKRQLRELIKAARPDMAGRSSPR